MAALLKPATCWAAGSQSPISLRSQCTGTLPAGCQYPRPMRSQYTRTLPAGSQSLRPLRSQYTRTLPAGSQSLRPFRSQCTRTLPAGSQFPQLPSVFTGSKLRGGTTRSRDRSSIGPKGARVPPFNDVQVLAASDEQATALRTLFPSRSSFRQGSVQVSDLHTVYYEEFGNASGRPALFLHGGPGAGCFPNHSRFFDPSFYRVVLLDQRGCGRSSPRGCLEDNDTWALVADIEKLREALGIDKWVVLGGSWGSTLALAYAQAHPGAVAGLVLRGVCLLRQREIDWFYKDGARQLFPFGWAELLEVLEEGERKDVVGAFYRRLTGEDRAVQETAAKAWLRWEFGLSSFSTASPVVYSWDGEKYSSTPSPVGAGAEKAASKAPPPAPPPTPAPSPTTSSTADAAPPAPSTPPAKNGATAETPPAAPAVAAEPPPPMSSWLTQARLESHYFINGGFLREGQLLEDIERIRHIPGVIVQGRFDFVCPVANAFDLHRAWPEAQLRIVPNAGHSMYEAGITHELILATEHLKSTALWPKEDIPTVVGNDLRESQGL